VCGLRAPIAGHLQLTTATGAGCAGRGCNHTTVTEQSGNVQGVVRRREAEQSASPTGGELKVEDNLHMGPTCH
jgi:hypothetical protein